MQLYNLQGGDQIDLCSKFRKSNFNTLVSRYRDRKLITSTLIPFPSFYNVSKYLINDNVISDLQCPFLGYKALQTNFSQRVCKAIKFIKVPILFLPLTTFNELTNSLRPLIITLLDLTSDQSSLGTASLFIQKF